MEPISNEDRYFISLRHLPPVRAGGSLVLEPIRPLLRAMGKYLASIQLGSGSRAPVAWTYMGTTSSSSTARLR